MSKPDNAKHLCIAAGPTEIMEGIRQNAMRMSGVTTIDWGYVAGRAMFWVVGDDDMYAKALYAIRLAKPICDAWEGKP